VKLGYTKYFFINLAEKNKRRHPAAYEACKYTDGHIYRVAM